MGQGCLSSRSSDWKKKTLSQEGTMSLPASRRGKAGRRIEIIRSLGKREETASQGFEWRFEDGGV